jgi:hypothetical protein
VRLASEGDTVENLALTIAARSGCFCNPASGFQMRNGLIDPPAKNNEMFVKKFLSEVNRSQSEEDLRRLFRFFGEQQGMIRMSFGPATNIADSDALVSCINRDMLSNLEDVGARAKD